MTEAVSEALPNRDPTDTPAPLTACRLCPHACGVDRTAGQRGRCRAGAHLEVYRYGPHHGEEPAISGSRGSGTIFFSRCTLRCIYCQNYPWSQAGSGRTMSPAELAAALRELAQAGCHNWNLVSPTPWLPLIREAVERAGRDSIRLPLVYNTSGFEQVEVLRTYRDLADVYLADLRYARAATAEDGSGCADYVARARAALREMWEQRGPLQLDADGVARSGMICRLLILPGHADEAVQSLEWLAATCGHRIAVSVMSQYTPAHRAPGVDGWNRRITARELERVRQAVLDLGLTEGWIQELDPQPPRELLGFNMEEGAGL